MIERGQVLFDDFEAMAPLGSGAFGEVWRVHDRNSGDDYALKHVPPGRAADREELRQNFKLHKELRSDHIVTARALKFDAAGSAYLVMDLIDGPSLGRWLADRAPLPFDLALAIAEQIAGALDEAHKKSIVHRDMKPANVVIDERKEAAPGVPFAVLVDLGLAAVGQAGIQSRSIEGIQNLPAGTPLYMAPEQYLGNTLTAGVDQWALAVIFYEMATGEHPFLRRGMDGRPLCEASCTGAPARPERLSEGQWAALSRAFRKRRQDRYATCAELCATLRSAPPPAVKPLVAEPAAAKPTVSAAPSSGGIPFGRVVFALAAIWVLHLPGSELINPAIEWGKEKLGIEKPVLNLGQDIRRSALLPPDDSVWRGVAKPAPKLPLHLGQPIDWSAMDRTLTPSAPARPALKAP